MGRVSTTPSVMRKDAEAASLSLPSLVSLEHTASQLLCDSLADPWGAISPSIYETAQVIRLLPADLRPASSICFVLNRQQADGSWGAHLPPVYRLVPTLSAICMLLHLTLEAVEGEGMIDAPMYVRAARAGLSYLATAWQEAEALPDTIAIELLLPVLREAIADLLRALHTFYTAPPNGVASALLDDLHSCLLMQLPPVESTLLTQTRLMAQGSRLLPVQMSHCLEVLQQDNRILTNVPAYEADGLFGGSPAATAARISQASADASRLIARLQSVAARFSGAFPVTYPITIYERAWVLFYLNQAGIALPETLKCALLSYLQACLGQDGVPYAEGLFPDADDTGVVLALLCEAGASITLDSLWPYERQTHFCCYSCERTPSVGVNAHVLMALARSAERNPPDEMRVRLAADKCVAYLLSTQRADGSWLDKWHASPYYATACCVAALRHIEIEEVQQALQRAAAWVLSTQRADGSWGGFLGTLEETAHALHILLDATAVRRSVEPPEVPDLSWDPADLSASEGYCCRMLTHAVWGEQALLRGAQFLLLHQDASPESPVHTPLWHGKDPYEPQRITTAIILGALYRCVAYLQAHKPAGGVPA